MAPLMPALLLAPPAPATFSSPLLLTRFARVLLPGIDAVKYKAHARLTACQIQLLHLNSTPVFVVVAKTATRHVLMIVNGTNIAENTCQQQ